MNTPVLTNDEQHNEAGAWFSKLSYALKSAMIEVFELVEHEPQAPAAQAQQGVVQLHVR